jgi:hypothetical protein
MHPQSTLRTIKLAHTLIWALFAGCIVAIPYFVWSRRLQVAVALIVVVMLEVIVLLVNRMRCPLTDMAARYTDDRRDNFDIYLPLWLAKYNKLIFGALFAAGLLYAVATR